MLSFKMGTLTPAMKARFHLENKTNKTGFLGVKYRRSDGKFYAYIRVPNRKEKLYCGMGNTAEVAAKAYDVKARQLWGDDAVVNFSAQRQVEPSSAIKERLSMSQENTEPPEIALSAKPDCCNRRPPNLFFVRNYICSVDAGRAELRLPCPGGRMTSDDAADVIDWLELIVRQIGREFVDVSTSAVTRKMQ